MFIFDTCRELFSNPPVIWREAMRTASPHWGSGHKDTAVPLWPNDRRGDRSAHDTPVVDAKMAPDPRRGPLLESQALVIGSFPRRSMYALYAYIGVVLGGQCRHIRHTWSVWVLGIRETIQVCFRLPRSFFDPHSTLHTRNRARAHDDWPRTSGEAYTTKRG